MEKESKLRRPVLLLAGSVWLIYLICLLKMSVMLIFFVLIFLSLRSRAIALLCLVLLVPLYGATTQGPSQVSGTVQVMQSRYLDEKKWDVYSGGNKYLYYGQQMQNGVYDIEAQVVPFLRKRSVTGFQEEAYYRSLGYSARIEVVKCSLLNSGALPTRIVLQSRAYDLVERYAEQRDFAFAFLFGGTQVLDTLYMQLFKQVGILHLLVVSGMHLKIYADFIRAVLKRLICPRLIQMILLWFVFVLLCLLTDFHVSCLRSFLLVIIKDILFILRRRMDGIEQLSLVSLLLLIINPYYGVTFSFILGTLAHASLLFTKSPSILTLYLCLLPFQLMFQAEVSILYLMFNILLAAVMDMLLPLMLISLVLSFTQPLIKLCLDGLLLTLQIMRDIDLFKFKVILLHPYSVMVIVALMYLFIFSTQSQAIYKRWQVVRYPVLIIFISTVFVIQFMQFNVWNRGVHFLDVGQGDASIIITEQGKHILIDTGNHPDIHQYMRYLGIERFDSVFITHRDADHSGKLAEILYDTLYTSRYTELPGAVLLQEGDRVEIDEVEIRVLSPNRAAGEENADSLVLRIEAGARTYLYGADVRADQLEDGWFREVDVFKFPHHGAASSLNPLLSAQKSPTWLILSYGRNNYGHPARSVLDYFNTQSVHHTYSGGSIHFRATGVYTY